MRLKFLRPRIITTFDLFFIFQNDCYVCYVLLAVKLVPENPKFDNKSHLKGANAAIILKQIKNSMLDPSRKIRCRKILALIIVPYQTPSIPLSNHGNNSEKFQSLDGSSSVCSSSSPHVKSPTNDVLWNPRDSQKKSLAALACADPT